MQDWTDPTDLELLLDPEDVMSVNEVSGIDEIPLIGVSTSCSRPHHREPLYERRVKKPIVFDYNHSADKTDIHQASTTKITQKYFKSKFRIVNTWLEEQRLRPPPVVDTSNWIPKRMLRERSKKLAAQIVKKWKEKLTIDQILVMHQQQNKDELPSDSDSDESGKPSTLQHTLTENSTQNINDIIVKIHKYWPHLFEPSNPAEYANHPPAYRDSSQVTADKNKSMSQLWNMNERPQEPATSLQTYPKAKVHNSNEAQTLWPQHLSNDTSTGQTQGTQPSTLHTPESYILSPIHSNMSPTFHNNGMHASQFSHTDFAENGAQEKIHMQKSTAQARSYATPNTTSSNAYQNRDNQQPPTHPTTDYAGDHSCSLQFEAPCASPCFDQGATTSELPHSSVREPQTTPYYSGDESSMYSCNSNVRSQTQNSSHELPKNKSNNDSQPTTPKPVNRVHAFVQEPNTENTDKPGPKTQIQVDENSQKKEWINYRIPKKSTTLTQNVNPTTDRHTPNKQKASTTNNLVFSINTNMTFLSRDINEVSPMKTLSDKIMGQGIQAFLNKTKNDGVRLEHNKTQPEKHKCPTSKPMKKIPPFIKPSLNTNKTIRATKKTNPTNGKDKLTNSTKKTMKMPSSTNSNQLKKQTSKINAVKVLRNNESNRKIQKQNATLIQKQQGVKKRLKHNVVQKDNRTKYEVTELTFEKNNEPSLHERFKALIASNNNRTSENESSKSMLMTQESRQFAVTGESSSQHSMPQKDQNTIEMSEPLKQAQSLERSTSGIKRHLPGSYKPGPKSKRKPPPMEQTPMSPNTTDSKEASYEIVAEDATWKKIIIKKKENSVQIVA